MKAEKRAYFVRITPDMRVRDEELRKLWDDDLIMIHYPGPQVINGGADLESTDPQDYVGDSRAQSVIRRFCELGQNGGYVWAECSFHDGGPTQVKVGEVLSGTPVVFKDAIWVENGPIEAGRRAKLKTLRLARPTLVYAGERLALKAGRPQQGTLGRWRAADEALPAIIEGRTLPTSWASLYPTLQEVACAEFLRQSTPLIPRLSHLLMPVGRTMKDVDIYGLAEDGKEILAQVTYHVQTSSASWQKMAALAPYRTTGAHVLFFCRCSAITVQDGILMIPVDRVFDWLQSERDLLSKLLSL